jgi:hypothetical protein
MQLTCGSILCEQGIFSVHVASERKTSAHVSNLGALFNRIAP